MLSIRNLTSRLASPESVPRRLASPKNPGGGHHMIGYKGKKTLNKQYYKRKMKIKLKNTMLFIRNTTSRLASPESVLRRLASPKNQVGGHHMIGYEGKTMLNKKILQKKAQDILKITLPHTQKVQVHPGAG